MTRSSRSGSTATPGRSRTRSTTSARRRPRRSTSAASRHLRAWSDANRRGHPPGGPRSSRRPPSRCPWSSDAAPPALEHVLDLGTLPVRDEHEQDVAGLDARTTARWDWVVAADDDCNERLTRQAELADGGACDRMVGSDAELLEVEQSGSRHFEWGTRRRRRTDEAEPLRVPLQRRALEDDRDEDDEEDGVEDRLGGVHMRR